MGSNLAFKMLRLKAGLRQLDIAKEMNVSENAVTKWETGRGRPSIELQADLANLLRCKVTDIIEAFEGVKQS